VSSDLSSALFAATALAYFTASVLFLAYLFGAAAGIRSARYAPRLLAAGTVMHSAQILVASIRAGVCPVERIHFAMSIVSLFLCLAYLACRVRWRIDVVGAFVGPLALTSLLASYFVALAPGPRFKSAMLPVHVAMNMLGVALFSLACGAAITYLVQEKQLKKKRLEGVFQRLPPLDSLDRAEHRLLLSSFPLLTIGIVTGSLWTKKIEIGGLFALLHAAFGYSAWLICAAVLLLRAGAGWRGRRAAYGTIAGFGFTVILLLLALVRSPEAPVAQRDLVGETIRGHG
jgi:ABC-type uncharacterized transport system permease subunit